MAKNIMQSSYMEQFSQIGKSNKKPEPTPEPEKEKENNKSTEPQSDGNSEVKADMVNTTEKTKKTAVKSNDEVTEPTAILGIALPKNNQSRTKDRRISLLVYGDVYDAFKDTCKELGLKPNDTVGKLMENFVNDYKSQKSGN